MLRNVDQLGNINIKIDYNIFSFFDGRWINEGQILHYIVLELF